MRTVGYERCTATNPSTIGYGLRCDKRIDHHDGEHEARRRGIRYLWPQDAPRTADPEHPTATEGA